MPSALVRSGASRLTAVWLLASFSAAGAPLEKRALKHGGRERTYYVAEPAAAAGPLRPAVIVLHGGGGNASGLERAAGDFSRLAVERGLVVVYPDGIRRHWNDGRPGIDADATIDDVGFLRTLVAELVAARRVDPKRIALFGMSNGGFMSYRFACEAGGEVKLVVPIVATLGEALSKRCRPARPTSILTVLGDEDKLVPFTGGRVRGPLGLSSRGLVLSSDETMAFWKRAFHCRDVTPVRHFDRIPGDGTRLKEESWSGCDGNVRLDRWTLEGAGHTWPGGGQYAAERLVGKVSRETDSARLLDFFLGLP